MANRKTLKNSLLNNSLSSLVSQAIWQTQLQVEPVYSQIFLPWIWLNMGPWNCIKPDMDQSGPTRTKGCCIPSPLQGVLSTEGTNLPNLQIPFKGLPPINTLKGGLQALRRKHGRWEESSSCHHRGLKSALHCRYHYPQFLVPKRVMRMESPWIMMVHL